jgi:hypothetical protein
LKHLSIKLLSLFAALLTTIILIGCGGGGGGGTTIVPPDNDTVLRSKLSEFNTSMDTCYDSLQNMINIKSQFENAITAYETSETDIPDQLWEDFSNETKTFNNSLESLINAEESIQSLTGAAPNRKSLTVAAGLGLYFLAMYELGSKLMDLNDDFTESKEKSDAAQIDGDSIEFNKERAKQVEIAKEVVGETGKSVISSTVMAPASPSTYGGILLKDFAGNQIADGIKALSSYDGKTIVLSETKDGKLHTATGTPEIALTGEDSSGNVTARTIIDVSEEETLTSIPPLPSNPSINDYEEITRELIPLTDATVQKVKENDAGEFVPESIELSYSELSKSSGTITYKVTATVSNVTKPITLSIEVNQANTSDGNKTLSAPGSVSWEVTVLTTAGSVKITRSDTGEWESIGLPAASTTPTTSTGFAGTWKSLENTLILSATQDPWTGNTGSNVWSGTYEAKNSTQSVTYDVVSVSISSRNISIDLAMQGTTTTILQMTLTLSADNNTLSGQLGGAGISAIDVSFNRQ